MLEYAEFYQLWGLHPLRAAMFGQSGFAMAFTILYLWPPTLYVAVSIQALLVLVMVAYLSGELRRRANARRLLSPWSGS
jgi:hypothetical protein